MEAPTKRYKGSHQRAVSNAPGRRTSYRHSAGRQRYSRARPVPRRVSHASINRARNRAVANLRTGGLVGIELKYWDQSHVDGALASGAGGAAPKALSGGEQDPSTSLCLNSPGVGSTAITREGRQIRAKSIYVSGWVSANGSTTHAPIIYIALVQDTQTNGTQLDSEAVFASVADDRFAATPLRNLAYTGRFKVLDSRQFKMDDDMVWNGAATLGSPSVVPFSLSAKLDFIQNFTAAGTSGVSDVGDISDNSLHVIAFTSSTAWSPQISYQSRFRFVG